MEHRQPPTAPDDRRDDGRERDPLFRELAGGALRTHRRDRGLRLVDVADRAGISPQYLSEIERGVKDPSSEVLAAAARAVGLDLTSLLRHVVAQREAAQHAPVVVPLRAPAPRRAPGGDGAPVCLAA